MEKREFVQELGKVLTMAKPHLVKCEYMLGKEIESNNHSPQGTYMPNDEFVVVYCENGYTYKINVSCNSLNAIAEAVFNAMSYK